jgi:hypothetical protein
MDEVLPVLAGFVLGLVSYAPRRWLNVVVSGVLSIGFGALSAWLSGELAVSWSYVLIDSAQVCAAAAMTGLLVRAWLRNRTRVVAR